MDKT
ncbi:hypothetical protein VCHENC02_1278A, partial [Vibrio harveyi]